MSADLVMREFERITLARGALADGDVRALAALPTRWVEVSWHPFHDEGRIVVQPQGIVGQIVLPSGRILRVVPKVPVARLWALIERACGIGDLAVRDDLVPVEGVEGVFDRVVEILARAVADRARRGLQHDYVTRVEGLSCVRGRLRVEALARAPTSTRLLCEHAEHSGDVDDNAILAWTLARALRGPLSKEQVRAMARRSLRAVEGVTSLRPFTSRDCEGRMYTRLTECYRPLHALCALVLDALAPSERAGERAMHTFVVDTARLFERYVASWLHDRAIGQWLLRAQHHVPLNGGGNLSFRIDLALFERQSGRCVAVLDTKYKRAAQPEEGDIQQAVAYAVAMGCEDAFLIYPSRATSARTIRVGISARVHCVAYDLDDDLDEAGEALWSRITARIASQPAAPRRP